MSHAETVPLASPLQSRWTQLGLGLIAMMAISSPQYVWTLFVKPFQTATGGTPFQREVWKALRAIPAGATKTYGQLAASLGCPTASRAVGAANGANPIGIVVPCHRVVGAHGKLTGYAGGLPRKRWLLDHESRFAPVAAGAQSSGKLL